MRRMDQGGRSQRVRAYAAGLLATVCVTGLHAQGVEDAARRDAEAQRRAREREEQLRRQHPQAPDVFLSPAAPLAPAPAEDDAGPCFPIHRVALRGAGHARGRLHGQSVTETQASGSRGSTVMAGGDVNLVASGAGKDSDLLIQGSNVKVGDTARLIAEGDVTLQAARNDSEEHSRQSNSSASVGIGISAGAKGTSFGFMASASKGKGQGDGSGTTHDNTHVSAGNLVVIDSGGDTTLKGATAQADQIRANVGGNLTIESLQDSATYKENSKNAGFSVTVGPSSGGSISAGKTNIDSNYQSANEQSGLKAGDGGFQVSVAGHTDLKGGAITSTDKAVDENRNRLETGSFGASNLVNQSSASADSSGINLSSNMLTQGKYGIAKAVVGNALNHADDSAHATAETRAVVSSGQIVITNESQQRELTGQTAEEAIASLNRDAASAHISVQKQDVQSMKQAVEAERAIKVEAFKQITAITTDAAYQKDTGPKKIVLQKTCGNDIPDCKPQYEVDLSQHDFVTGPNGEIYVFNHGIMNDEEQALANARVQMGGEALQAGIYTVINPDTGNPVAEVIYAGWDKLREVTGLTWLFGVSNASQANIDIREKVAQHNAEAEQTGAPKLVIVEVAHSRGSLTTSNALQVQLLDGKTNVPLGSVTLHGAAANAQRTADRVHEATSGQGQVYQSTHKDDLVGRVIGGNAPTGGVDAPFAPAHGVYGPGHDLDEKNKVWGTGVGSVVIPVQPKSKEVNQ